MTTRRRKPGLAEPEPDLFVQIVGWMTADDVESMGRALLRLARDRRRSRDSTGTSQRSK